VAYDPIGHKIAFAGFESDTLLIYDIAKGTFTPSSASPGGSIHDNTCGDNSGGLYVGSGNDENANLPLRHRQRHVDAAALDAHDHDNNSTCVVSQDGYLYEATGNGPGFYRLPLGTYATKK
jgi:hypothetical protein